MPKVLKEKHDIILQSKMQKQRRDGMPPPTHLPILGRRREIIEE